MKIGLVVFSALFLTFTSLVSGDSSTLGPILSSYRIYNLPAGQLKAISERFEITRKLNDRVNVGYEVIVPVDRKNEFLGLAPDALLVESNIAVEVLNNKFLQADTGYRSYAEVLQTLEGFAATYPEIAQVVQYGTSKGGLPLKALKLSDNVAVDEAEPELMFTAATHGDEIITTEILLNLIERLVKGYGVDTRLTALVSERELYFIPVVNADGFVRVQRYEEWSDPNRSYPYPEKPDAKPTPSIASLIEFFGEREFVGSIDYHAYGEMVMYPWAYTYSSVDEKDSQIFHPLTQSMAATNSYAYGPISKVIYVAKGSSADYYYWKKKTIALAVEVGNSKAPHPSQIPAYTEEQAEAMWRFIEAF